MNDSSNLNQTSSQLGSPICLFYFSYPFSIGSNARPGSLTRLRIPSHAFPDVRLRRKRAGRNVAGVRRRFRRLSRNASKYQNALVLVKCLTERYQRQTRNAKLPRLLEVIETLQAAWSPNNKLNSHSSCVDEPNNSPCNMQEQSICGFPSPVLLRRRLSAPETIMRKHSLAQLRSESLDSDTTQVSSVSPLRSLRSRSLWNRGSTTGSDSNLSSRKSFKQDPDFMRKSALVKRLWNKEYAGGADRWPSTEAVSPSKSPKHARSRQALRSSPERSHRLRTVSSSESAGARKPPPFVNYVQQPDTKMVLDDTCKSENFSRISSTSVSNKMLLYSSSGTIRTTSTPKTLSTESEINSTRSTTATTGTNMDDNSDSAYTNTQSYTQTDISSNSTSENNGNSKENGNDDVYTSNYDEKCEYGYKNNSNCSESFQLVEKVNPELIKNAPVLNYGNEHIDFPDTATKTGKNSTQEKNLPFDNSSNSDRAHSSVVFREHFGTHDKPSGHENQYVTCEVKKVESFYLNNPKIESLTPGHSRIIKYMISNVDAGSVYKKPIAENQLVVPRYSALPTSSSMEVNISSEESTDIESDNVSLVDSLDDTNSPRQSGVSTQRSKYDDKLVRGDLTILLPDNSSSCQDTPKIKSQKKSSVFFVPISKEESCSNVRTVAEHMPDKVRSKLSKRLQRIEQKKLHSKNKTDNSSSSQEQRRKYVDTNGNQTDNAYTSDSRTSSFSDAKRSSNDTDCAKGGTLKRKQSKDKPLSRELQPLSTNRMQSNGNVVLNLSSQGRLKRIVKPISKKIMRIGDKTDSMAKSLCDGENKIYHSYFNKNEYLIESIPKRIYRKTEMNNLNKRIEILEIMECLDSKKSGGSQYFKNSTRSKIPVLVQHRSVELPEKQMQFETAHSAFGLANLKEDDPKIDQLIANILIDALNKSDMQVAVSPQKPELSALSSSAAAEKRPTLSISGKYVLGRYQQRFEIIPEEKITALGCLTTEAQVVQEEEEDARALDEALEKVPAAKSAEVETQVGNEELDDPAAKADRQTMIDASCQTETESSNAKSKSQQKGKSVLAVVKEEDLTEIPKGWITFYMMRKNPDSPCSSIDEGHEQVIDSEQLEKKKNDLSDSKYSAVEIPRRNSKSDFVYENEPRPRSNRVTDIVQDKIVISSEGLPRYPVLPDSNDNLMISKKDMFDVSSESSKSQSPCTDHTHDRSSSLNLPVAYMPIRQNRRQSHRRGRNKSSQNQGSTASHAKGGWSVTVSGTNSCGQPAPDLEMRLKFPCQQATSQSDSGLGEEPHPQERRQTTSNNFSEKVFHLPPTKPIQTKKFTVITRKQTNEYAEDVKNDSFKFLPDLIKNKYPQQPIKQYRSSVPVRQTQVASSATRMPPLKATSGLVIGRRPRQTLTSYRRFSLHHSSHLPPHLRTMLPSAAHVEARKSMQLPECITDILTINGSAISPEHKPHVPILDRESRRNHFNLA